MNGEPASAAVSYSAWPTQHRINTYIRRLLLLILLMVLIPRVESADRVPVSGKVMFGGTPLCAMVLANGQNMFSCSGDGSFNLMVPLDGNGKVTLMTFAQGFAPFRQTLSPAQVANITVNMEREPEGRSLVVVHSTQASTRTGWIVVNGTIGFNGTPVCALMLANGQHMFSCNADLGQFSLEVPLDSSGNVTLFAFVSGFQPFKVVIPAPGGGGGGGNGDGKTLTFNTSGILANGIVDWAAYRDGDGPWQRWNPAVTQSNGDVYTASITNAEGRYSFAYHQLFSFSGSRTDSIVVNHATLAEQRVWWEGGVECGSFSGTLTASEGTTTSINNHPLGSGGAGVPFSIPNFCAIDVPPHSPVDLVATQNVPGQNTFGQPRPERFLIKRNLDSSSGSITGLNLDLVSSGVGTHTAPLTITESDSAATVQIGQGLFLTTNFGMASISDVISNTSSTLYLPASGVLATDALWLSAFSIPATADGGKTINRFIAAQGFTGDNINLDQVKPMDFASHVNLGSWPDTVEVTYTPGPNSPSIGSYLLVGSTGELLPNFASGAIRRQVMATAGWLQGATQIPIGDLDSLAGYDTAWNVVPGAGDFDAMQVTVFMADSPALGSLLGSFDFRTDFGDNHQVFANCPTVSSRCSLW